MATDTTIDKADRHHRNRCGLCQAAENVDCTGTSTNHYGRAWRLAITAPGNHHAGHDTLHADGGACRPTIEETYLWDHTRRDDRFPSESVRVAILHRGACLGCGWSGEPHQSENAAVEDAHDHSWPGWRDLPIVPRRPDDTKAQAKWRAHLTALYRVAGIDVDHWLAVGAPFRTARIRGQQRSHCVWGGGYDICGIITERPEPCAPTPATSEEQLALW